MVRVPAKPDAGDSDTTEFERFERALVRVIPAPKKAVDEALRREQAKCRNGNGSK